VALRVIGFDEITSRLEEVSKLARLLEQRHSEFPRQALDWLARVEDTLARHGVPAVSQVAAARMRIAGAMRGMPAAGAKIAGRPTRRKLADAAASEALQQVQAELHAQIAPRQAQFDQAEQLSRQVITFAEAKGLLAGLDAASEIQSGSPTLRKRLEADGDLAGPWVQLKAMVGSTDASVFLGRQWLEL